MTDSAPATIDAMDPRRFEQRFPGDVSRIRPTATCTEAKKYGSDYNDTDDFDGFGRHTNTHFLVGLVAAHASEPVRHFTGWSTSFGRLKVFCKILPSFSLNGPLDFDMQTVQAKLGRERHRLSVIQG